MTDAVRTQEPTSPRVTVVIPARDEERAVAGVVAELAATLQADARFTPFELIVVDDGSRDRTADRARGAGARVLRTDWPRGYGAALKRGIRASMADYVCVVDADQTYPAAALPAMLDLLDEGADQVVGARIVPGTQIRWHRRLVKGAITRFASLLAQHPITDLNSGMRCFRRSRIEPILRMFPDGFSFSTTLTVAALLEGWEVRWHPISYNRRLGSSKFRPVRDTLRLLFCLARAILYFDPLRVFLPAAVGLGICALAVLGWDICWEHNLTDKTVLLSLSSLELVLFGLLADLIVKKR